jgi:hypothetical protein
MYVMRSYQHTVIIALVTYYKSLIQIRRRGRARCRHSLLALCGFGFSFLVLNKFHKSLLRRIAKGRSLLEGQTPNYI